MNKQRVYGNARDIYVTRKPQGNSLIFGGSAEDGRPFARVVTTGAARVMWFYLTRHLYPEHADVVTALVQTAPLRPFGQPAVTSHVTIETDNDDIFLVSGWGGRDEWRLRLTREEARRLWQSLDIVLHPVGW